MQSIQVAKLYENGRRGRPVATIYAGDLSDPYPKGPWARFVSFLSTVADVIRESRELETKMLGAHAYRRHGEA